MGPDTKDGSQNWGSFAHLYMLCLVGKGLTIRDYGSFPDIWGD